MTEIPAGSTNWTPSRVYGFYRILLVGALTGIFFLTWPLPLVGQYMPGLYAATILVYSAIAVASLFLTPLLHRQFPRWHSLLPIVIDIAALTLIIHASGGIKGNLSVLLVVTVAAASILLPGRGGMFVAALTTFAVMGEQFWFAIQLADSNPLHLTESGLLGLSFFFTAIIIHQIARRLAQTEELSIIQRQEISRLEALNLQILQRMRTGILVFNAEDKVVMTN